MRMDDGNRWRHPVTYSTIACCYTHLIYLLKQYYYKTEIHTQIVVRNLVCGCPLYNLHPKIATRIWSLEFRSSVSQKMKDKVQRQRK